MDYLERLSQNPDFQELLKVVQEERDRALHQLAYMNPVSYDDYQGYLHDLERAKGVIHGLDRFLRAPDAARQLLSQKEMNDE